MLTLDEAIKHCEEKAKELRERADVFDGITSEADVIDCIECANEHEQLAEWLENYKRLLEEEPEVYMTAKDYNLYLEGYKQGRKDFGRPQGKWICDYRTCKCSVCNFTTVIDTYNYCPNCGAEMQKGGAE